MSVGYKGVQWSRHKRIYDGVLLAAVALTLGAFMGVSFWLRPGITGETAIIRGTALTAFLLLHAILAIGPLARLDRRFLPLLYNRRHAGVTMFLLALTHGAFAIFQFHAFGNANPLKSALGAYREDYLPGGEATAGAWSLAHMPFEVFGFAALGILFLMAATSHDFWNRNLGPSAWKTLHVLVLAAYGSLVLHVALGVLQSERSPLYLVLLGLGAGTVFGLHLWAGTREVRRDRRRKSLENRGFERACRASEVDEGRGRVVQVGGERRAVFRHQGRLFALSNVCCHQGGPLGEGQVIDGCVTCPWHGWQYRPEDGKSPPPFEETVPTYAVEVLATEGGTEDSTEDAEVWIARGALPEGTVSSGVEAPAAASAVSSGTGDADDDPFYVGYLPVPAELQSFLRRVAAVLLIALPALAGGIAAAQRPFDPGTFEFGVHRTFEGILYERPLARIHLTAPLAEGSSDEGLPRDLLVVGSGKFGMPEVAQGSHGKIVRFDGSLIYGRGLAMAELNAPESFEIVGPPSSGDAGAAPGNPAQGPVELVGELVDSKCFLGVMRPAQGKVHRGCAVRCLSGGIPPALVLPDGRVFLLTGPDAKALDFDVQWAARHVRVVGEPGLEGEIPVVRVTEMSLVEP